MYCVSVYIKNWNFQYLKQIYWRSSCSRNMQTTYEDVTLIQKDWNLVKRRDMRVMHTREKAKWTQQEDNHLQAKERGITSSAWFWTSTLQKSEKMRVSCISHPGWSLPLCENRCLLFKPWVWGMLIYQSKEIQSLRCWNIWKIAYLKLYHWFPLSTFFNVF